MEDKTSQHFYCDKCRKQIAGKKLTNRVGLWIFCDKCWGLLRVVMEEFVYGVKRDKPVIKRILNSVVFWIIKIPLGLVAWIFGILWNFFLWLNKKWEHLFGEDDWRTS